MKQKKISVSFDTDQAVVQWLKRLKDRMDGQLASFDINPSDNSPFDIELGFMTIRNVLFVRSMDLDEYIDTSERVQYELHKTLPHAMYSGPPAPRVRVSLELDILQ